MSDFIKIDPETGFTELEDECHRHLMKANGAIVLVLDEFLDKAIRDEIDAMSVFANVDKAGRVLGFTVKLWPRGLPEESPPADHDLGRPTRRRPRFCR
jgi:hypothetical protein